MRNEVDPGQVLVPFTEVRRGSNHLTLETHPMSMSSAEPSPIPMQTLVHLEMFVLSCKILGGG